MKRDISTRQSTTSTISFTLSKEEKRKKKRPKFLRRKKKNKNKDETMIDTVPDNEKSKLLIHATFREPSPAEKRLEQAKHTLYFSHFVAKFSELGWQFCLILFLTALTNYKSLVLVSTYGLFTGLVVCLTGPSAGALVDSKNHNRLKIAQFFIWIQNLSVIIATCCCFFLLRMVPSSVYKDDESEKIQSEVLPDLAPPATFTTWILLIAVHIFGACGRLTDQSMTVAMERDWIVVMSKIAGGHHDDEFEDVSFSESEDYDTFGGNESDVSSLSVGNASFGYHSQMDGNIINKLKEKTWLSQTNTAMTQIDLICKVAAPAAAGIFFACFDDYKAGDDFQESHWYNLSYAALIIGVLNLISLYVENDCMQRIYDNVPLLAADKGNDVNDDINVTSPTGVDNDDAGAKNSFLFSGGFNRGLRRLSTIQSVNDMSSWSLWDNEDKKEENRCNVFTVPRGLRLYLQQPIFFGGFALSLLYLNILSFGALMTAYLVWRGMSDESIGTLRGISSIIGLMGTFAYHFSNRYYSLSFTGSWSIMFQFTCLTLCYISLFVPSEAASLAMLIIGVIASRIGLYVFDLTITQFMQQMIPEDIRGVIGGVQKSFNGMFDLATYALGLFFTDPSHFSILVATGYVSVGIAMCLYLWGVHYYKDVIQLHCD